MRKERRRAPWLLGGLLVLAWALLVGCERPDPQESVVLSPTTPPTAPPQATVATTQAPVQVYVVVVQPTAPISPTPATQLQIAAPTGTPWPVLPTSTPPVTLSPTVIPEDYYQAWAWTDGLEITGEQAVVDQYGMLLRDRPSRDGREIGLVVGYANLVVVGQARCGYTPVLVHEYSLLSKISPHPEIATAMPLPTEMPPFAPTPFPDRSGVVSGWAYTDELTILGETAISGPLGVNLRSDPCLDGTNLGFIPAGANMIVTGWPSGNYTPVRINKDVLQEPLDLLARPPLVADDALSGVAPTPQTLSPTPVPSATLTETVTLTPTLSTTLTPAATISPTVDSTPSPTTTP